MNPVAIKEQLICALFPYVLKQPFNFRETLTQAVEEVPEFVMQLAHFYQYVLLEKEKAYLLTIALFQTENGRVYGKKHLLEMIEKPEDVLTALHYYLAYNGKPISNLFRKTLEIGFQRFEEEAFLFAKTKEGTVTFADFLHLIHPEPKNEAQRITWGTLLEKKKARTLDVYSDMHQVLHHYSVDQVCAMLQREKKVPAFRLFELLQFLKKRTIPTDNTILKILEARFQEAAQQLPVLKGKTFIASDVSASMNTPLSVSRLLNYRDIAQFYMAGASVQCEKTILSFYASDFAVYKKRDERVGCALLEEFEKITLGFGSNASLAVNYLLENALFVERILLFSDKPSLPEDVQKQLNQYRETINPLVQVHLFYLVGGKGKVYKQQHMHHYSGWSDSLYSFLYFLEKTPAQLVDLIESMQKNTSP